MPVHIITAAPGAGPAAAATAQVLAFATHAAAIPLVLLDLRTEPVEIARLTPRLIPCVPIAAKFAPAILGGVGTSAIAIARVGAATPDSLAPLLAEADTLTICASRLGRALPEASQLCDVLDRMAVRNRAGRVIRPWLLAAGWAGSRNVATRMQAWRQKLDEVAPSTGLRCLPLVQPWDNPSWLPMADRTRVGAIGAALLRHLDMIAGGRLPERPAGGGNGGDPWPDRPNPAPLGAVARIGGTRLRLVQSRVAP